MSASAVHRVASKVTNDDWKMCRQWISELKVLPVEHQLFRCTQLVEFANMLRDGVILCQVLNRIVPGAIPREKVTIMAKSMHFSLSNTALVRTAIIDKLGINPEEVFGERDLANLENFYKVLLTLSQLSRLPQALPLGAKAWPPADRHLNDDDQIYGRLDEMPLSPVDSSSPLALPPRRPGLSTSSMSVFSSSVPNNDAAEADDDDVYQNLAFQCDAEEESVYDKVVAQPTVKPQATTKREYAIKELINTEETYVGSLKLLVQELMQPSRVFMNAEPWFQLFQYFDQLYSLHKAFHDELRVQVESALQPNNKNKLNLLGIWQRRKREFLVYTKYVVNKPIAEAAYDKIMKPDEKNDRMRLQFMERCASVQKMMSSRSFSLREYLFVPIQRVLKYHLLLEAIAKNTPDEDEKKNMRESLVIISDIQRCINEAQRDGEMLDRIQIIQSAIADMTLPPDTKLCDYGRMHIDGEMLVRSHADARSSVRFVFLFDFMLIICKMQPRQPQQYKLRDCCYVTNLDVADLDQTAVAAFRPKDRFEHPFEIRKRSGASPEDPTENVYTMAVRTENERRSWINALTTARDNLRPSGYMNSEHHFVYKTFAEPYECDVCGKFMAGGLFQGYECAIEYCRMACHMKCLPKAPPQPDRRPEPVMALRAYDGASPEHPRRLQTLKFAAKDIISLWVRCSPDWAYGEFRDSRGFFPLSYVCEKRPFPLQSFVANGPQDLSNFPWYVGEMAKEIAGQYLKVMRSGTFLVRKSGATSQRPGEYAISLKYDASEINANFPHDSLEHIRHIRVVKMDSRFSLSQDPPFFPCIADLVSYYQQKSLQPVFNELPTALLFPYQGPDWRNPMFEARVLFDFQPSTQSELRLIANEHVEVVATNVTGRPTGEWWRGRNRSGNVGIFPASYVRRI